MVLAAATVAFIAWSRCLTSSLGRGGHDRRVWLPILLPLTSVRSSASALWCHMKMCTMGDLLYVGRIKVSIVTFSCWLKVIRFSFSAVMRVAMNCVLRTRHQYYWLWCVIFCGGGFQMRPRSLCGSASEIMFGCGVSFGGQCINCTVIASSCNTGIRLSCSCGWCWCSQSNHGRHTQWRAWCLALCKLMLSVIVTWGWELSTLFWCCLRALSLRCHSD